MTTGMDIVNEALKYKGLKYVWGGYDLNTGVDCSGLVQEIFKKFGITTGRTTWDQIGKGTAVNVKGLRPGDLVFFDTDRSVGGPDHVGIYMGGGKMVEAPKPGGSVQVTDMTQGYWMSRFMGGRRLDGYNSVGGSVKDYAAPEEVKMTPEEMASNYGWSFGFLNSEPELKKIFDQAVTGTWTSDKFKAEVRNTNWWKTNSDTRRQAQVMKKTDPASWNAAVAAEVVKVQQLAAEMGAAVPPAKLKQIAQNSIELGMDENLLRNALGGYITFTKDATAGGEAGAWMYAMRQYASNMGVELSDDALKNHAQRVVRRVASSQEFEDHIRQQAKSLLPGYADAIDAGSTVREIADPYVQLMSQELQLPYGSIKLDDPIIKRALNGMSADGKPTGISVADFQTQLRNDPRWAQTSNAQNGAMATANAVLKDMGLSF